MSWNYFKGIELKVVWQDSVGGVSHSVPFTSWN
jgi:hypothetical protein